MKSAHLAIAILSTLLIVYFVFPASFVVPLRLFYGRSFPPHILRILEVALAPIDFFAKRMPRYENFLRWQVRIFD